ncbi:hypothetical protein BDW22DRAFT_1425971 [Trametopsis cervina]|nr:hypothetical protein BDW22DRAFT_1425971 [Trametopsis cervina]
MSVSFVASHASVMSAGYVSATEDYIVSPSSAASSSRFKLHGPRDKPRQRAASVQAQQTSAETYKRRYTVSEEPTTTHASSAQQRPLPVSPVAAEQVELARWRDEVLKLMLTASGHHEIQQGLERFRERGMPALATRTTGRGLPSLTTCTMPNVCSCGPCLRAARQSKQPPVSDMRGVL